MKDFLNMLFLIVPFLSFSQVSDDFSDGDFTNNPIWSGTVNQFIVNPSFQLQTDTNAAAASYLATPHLLPDLADKEWKFYAKMSFAGSATNYARIYLTADNPNLNLVLNGYYIQLGEALSTDAVRLFRLENGVSTQICASADGTIVSSANIGVRVLRSATGNWQLFVDFSGGQNYVLQGSGTDVSTLLGTHFGILAKYTVGNIKKFYFDNLYVGSEIVDVTPPSLVSSTVISSTEVELIFSEDVEQTTIENTVNYAFNPTITLVSATRDALNFSKVTLVFTAPFTNGVTHQFTVNNVTDLTSNSNSVTGNFTYLVAENPLLGDVIISEFMADPSPVIGLPELEFVEIYNKSTKYFNLTGWKLGDNASDGTITAGWLAPGEYKVLCAASSVSQFPGSIAVTSFPSLNNGTDDVVIKNSSGIILDKITYFDTWYRDEVKKQGGYTLERINPNHPCSDANNWIASTNQSGGTPGTQNSVYDITPNNSPLQIVSSKATMPNLLEIQFSKGLDSMSVFSAAYTFNPTLTINLITVADVYPRKVLLEFQENLVQSQLYQFTIGNIQDCWMNNSTLNGQFILAEEIAAGDLLINEILFNPITGGSDFVEIRNNSNKVLDVKNLYLANIKSGAIGNHKQILSSFVLYPNELVVVTPDTLSQLQTYPMSVPGRFIQMTLPSYNTDSSTVFLLKDSTTILDKVSYSAKWHLKLIADVKAKSLEKIDPLGASNDNKNWHTAAEAVGFATPGAPNSQYSPAQYNGNFSLTSTTVSPDNDGFEDVLQINYVMEHEGMVANVKIFDDRGRLIKHVCKNELLGTEGSLIWDGITESNLKASIGTYVVIFEAFKTEGGDLFVQKKAFVVAGKL